MRACGKTCHDYRDEHLFADGSVDFKGEDRDALLAQTAHDAPVIRLSHPEVRYEVTDRCNAACIMCPRDLHKHGRPHGIMELAPYQKSIDEVAALGAKQIVLTGFGEPLIDRTLERKIAYAKQRGLRTYIISNISLLTKERSIGLIRAGLDELRASFLGMRPETYERVMVHLKFDVSMNNLLTFLEQRQRLGSKTPKLQISYLVLPENEGDTQAFKEFWEPRADAIEIWKPHNFGDGRDYRERLEDVGLKKSCGRPANGPLQIQWNGEVIPCCYDYNNQIVLGNAFERPVLEILNHPKYRLLRLAHQEGKFHLFPYCNQCDQLLPHADALIYTNRHNLPPEEAVKLSNTDLYNLIDDKPIESSQLKGRYADAVSPELKLRAAIGGGKAA
ncbi:MAG: SPASM domain-containing protein [Candidatus Omnitrophica bacterium]|nr:SPASM domain-containing protein [Candidatus Omnitrophota bacterium]